jgi:hypothetical protein
MRSVTALVVMMGLVTTYVPMPVPLASDTSTVPEARAAVKAFPTAEGFGQNAQGGRGGQVYSINSLSSGSGTATSLTGSGTITFRDCLLDRFGVGARTCVFRVGGIIDWPCAECYSTVPPYLTIAGQTAPGNGIMIKSMQLEMRSTHNVIIRHLRVRPSESIPTSSSGRAIPSNGQGATPTHDIIVDHSSVGWTSDDTIGGTIAYNVTYQWNLVSEGIRLPPDPTSKASLWAGNISTGNSAVSYLHNYFAHFDYRVPNFEGGDGQIVNNVLYNIVSVAGTYAYPVFTVPVHMNIINNYYRPGPNSTTNAPRVGTYGCGSDAYVNCTSAAQSAIHLNGNIHTTLRPNNTYPETALLYQVGTPITVTSSPFGFPALTSQTSATQAVTDVLAKSGATVPMRDSIDQRAINDFNNRHYRV